jgi:hypothetical protein
MQCEFLFLLVWTLHSILEESNGVIRGSTPKKTSVFVFCLEKILKTPFRKQEMDVFMGPIVFRKR